MDVKLGDVKAMDRAWMDRGDAGDGLAGLMTVMQIGFDEEIVEVERV